MGSRGIFFGATLVSILVRANAVPHGRFVYDAPSGLIKFKDKPELHLNVEGGVAEPGKAVVMWPEQSQRNEVFEHVNGQIRSTFTPSLCLNAEGGASAGSKIVLWPCGKPEDGSLVEHEQFVIDSVGKIKFKTKGPNGEEMCINVKDGDLRSGAALIVWVCQDNNNEKFKLEDGLVKLKADERLHFNIMGGKIEAGSQVVLFHSHGGSHEVFEFANIEQGVAKGKTAIRLKNEPGLCLNAEEGAEAGRKIVLWPCQGDENEAFTYNGNDNTITSAYNSNLAFNAAGGAMQAGDGIVLWPLKEEL